MTLLVEMTIENFAIIEKLHLTFHSGMNALTGETGAGKSIIIDAMGLLAGSRSSLDMIRQGAEKCRLEGVFEWPQNKHFLELASEYGVDQEEDFMIVQRDISSNGKSICRVNGRMMTLANLRRLGMFLVDIQGQNDHQALLQPEQHLRLVDDFGSPAFKEKRQNYRVLYEEFVDLKQQVRSLQQNEQSFAQRMDMLHFQLDEIAEAELMDDEEESLIEERDRLMNHQKIVDAFGLAYQSLSNDGQGAMDLVSLAMNELEDVKYLSKDYEKMNESVQSAYYLLQDVVGDLSRQIDRMEFDEPRLEEIMGRLELIRQLKRKYGDSIPVILAYYDKIRTEVDASDYSDAHLEQLEKKLEETTKTIRKLAEELHIERKKIAKVLELGIMSELKQLYMENAQFEIRFETTDGEKVTEYGLDKVSFYLTTNPGEPLKPLVKVASGGELSRILLALKTVFTKNQELTSIVFDEVDTGVSGRVAQAIAEKIATIGAQSQVLCITHLPQVAAFADYQYFIAKKVESGRTKTSVHILSEKERVAEVARMLAGAEVTNLTLEHAQELLAMAKKTKQK